MSFNTLNIGATALITQQAALNTVGQNISNASTPGYSRQRVIQQAVRPQVFSFGAVGTGVSINQIARVADEFLEQQVRSAKGSHDYYEKLQDGYENLEVFFNELTDQDISTAMNDFWDAVGDFTNNVEDVSNRRTVLESAESVRDAFQTMDRRLRDYRLRLNEAVKVTVDRVNTLLYQVAALNADIVKMEAGGTTGVVANDLRDQRTERVKELAGIMDLTVTENDNGSVLLAQRSRVLVQEDHVFDLKTLTETNDDILIDIPVFSEDEEELTIGDGLLFAQTELRDTILASYKDDMDQMAASFAWEFNRVHSQGIGLIGYTDVTAANAVIDPALTLDRIAYDFTPKANTYAIQNGNFEIVVHNTGSDEEFRVNVEIDLDGTADADTILYDRTNPAAANALVNKIQSALDSVRQGAFQVDVDLNNHLRIRSTTNELEFGFGRDTSGVLAALGLNTFFDGYDAGSFKIGNLVTSQPDLMTGARSFTPGDNEGAVALLQLRETKVLDNNTATLDDYYESIVGRLGVEAARVDSQYDTQKNVLVRMENQREDLSGVNLDEELTKLIQYQRSFQSAARFISTADTLYDTLINM